MAILAACKRDSDYVKSTPSPFISNLDLRKLYKGADVTLTKEVTREATFVTGQVTSDHSGNNLPAGLLFIQNLRMVGSGIDSLRGIAINIGAAAANYVPGDSVSVKIEGSVLKRVDGILQITGVSASSVEKVASGIKLITTPISAVSMLAKPENFEGCLGVVYNCNFEPNIGVETIEGVKTLNEGSGNMQMNVSGAAGFKSELLPWSANVTGIVIPSAATGVPMIWPPVSLWIQPFHWGLIRQLYVAIMLTLQVQMPTMNTFSLWLLRIWISDKRISLFIPLTMQERLLQQVFLLMDGIREVYVRINLTLPGVLWQKGNFSM
jgi:hypothetical protein